MAVPLTAYRLRNTCRPTIISRSSLPRNLQRVDMVAALGDSSAPQPSLPHSRPRALFSSKAAPQSPYIPLTAPFQLPLASPSNAAPETDDLRLDPHTGFRTRHRSWTSDPTSSSERTAAPLRRSAPPAPPLTRERGSSATPPLALATGRTRTTSRPARSTVKLPPPLDSD